MRTHSVLFSRNMRAVVFAASLIAAAGCGGSGSSGTTLPPDTFGLCDPGTQVSLANPNPGQIGVSTNTNPILIVANGNSNTLYQSYTNFDVLLVDGFGNRITSAPLALTTGNGYKPYPSDFYYSASLPNGLNFGTTYSAYLNIFSSNCQQLPFLGNFST